MAKMLSASGGALPPWTRAESVTENRNRYRDILKTETDTNVGIEKPKTDGKSTEKKNSVFADDDLLISSIFIFCR